jgi:hypothetical protein
MAPAHSGHGSQVRVHGPPLGRSRPLSVDLGDGVQLCVGEPGPGELTPWRVARVEDAVACLGGDHTVRVNHDRADRNGASDVSGPRLAKGATPVFRQSTPPFINGHKSPPFHSGGT